MTAHSRIARPTLLGALLLGILGPTLGLTHAARAEPPPSACGPRDQVIARLAETYGERRQSMGLGNNNAVMEVFASDTTGSWTITVTSTNGITCLVASGLAFETLHERLAPKESDA